MMYLYEILEKSKQMPHNKKQMNDFLGLGEEWEWELAYKGAGGYFFGVTEIFYIEMVLYTFVKIHQTVHISGVDFCM